MDFLVVRDKNKKTVEVLSFENFADAKAEKQKRKAEGWEGELILSFANDLKSFFMTYTEYRPPNWQQLVEEKNN